MNICIIGLGLIGGSFALALCKHSLAERIFGVDASPRNAQKALELGLVDEVVIPFCVSIFISSKFSAKLSKRIIERRFARQLSEQIEYEKFWIKNRYHYGVEQTFDYSRTL